MTDESEAEGAQPTAEDALVTGLDRPFTEMTVDELMALKAEYEARGISIYNSLSASELVLVGLALAYSKTFVETLAKNNADWLSDAVGFRYRKSGKGREVLIGADNGAAATLVITSDTPDEARLALLDLDVTADDLRGRNLRWDSQSKTWRPDGTGD
jgi:hypothetical protein